ncbi:hypothetical protein AAC03nite_00440 [Alicyclobacillus acidoterrestris]|uniref:hypothetical protein n=1 Tax=Alicyclobacillus suci TaxID=2816080 RepID=UPI001195F791|nr:hypothetical protein [Alicyclobacillus suci]GEO24259.1 hypothetical protein AAC03nite_00440 [Alicyclobacillus acidoterrestris]
MKRIIIAWLISFFLIVFLYVGATALWVNHLHPSILSMPPLYAWFVLVPLVNPIILWILYRYDLKYNPQIQEGTDDVN